MKRLRVVLAEDHEAVRDGLRLLFETRGDMDVVHGVPNGAEAIEAARTLTPDVIVLDLSMPGVSGLAAAREIKAQTPRVAVVVLDAPHRIRLRTRRPSRRGPMDTSSNRARSTSC